MRIVSLAVTTFVSIMSFASYAGQCPSIKDINFSKGVWTATQPDGTLWTATDEPDGGPAPDAGTVKEFLEASVNIVGEEINDPDSASINYCKYSLTGSNSPYIYFTPNNVMMIQSIDPAQIMNWTLVKTYPSKIDDGDYSCEGDGDPSICDWSWNRN